MSERIKLYRPANGTEADLFIEMFCEDCERDRAYRERDEGSGCPILARTFMHQIDHPDYPQEWRIDDEGDPICTAFVEQGQDVPLSPERCEHTADMFGGEAQ